VKFWTAHLRGDAEPVLVREGFSWGALIFGPLWLALHRSWIPAALSLAAWVLVAALTPPPVAGVLNLGLAVFLGLTGNDLVRWSFEHRGFLLVHVLAARNETDAWARLLASRPDLAGRFMPAGSIR
jgi:Protein of unknown function (DUF2628)